MQIEGGREYCRDDEERRGKGVLRCLHTTNGLLYAGRQHGRAFKGELGKAGERMQVAS